MFSDAVARLAVLAAERHGDLERAHDAVARGERARDYREVKTPILYDVELWKQSGHWAVYRDNMYFADVEGRTMGLKPMNCPAHVQIYKRRAPLLPRPADPLLRAGPRPPPRAERDAARPAARAAHHPGRRPHLLHRGADRRTRSSAAWTSASRSTTRSASSRGSSCRRARRSGSATEEMWDKAEAALENALVDKGLEYELNPGDGAFYGPKIDLHMTDSIGRSWQLGTVQLDYYMPERFELTYTGADNAEHRPVMIHRALMGSFERFIGILIEHYAGEFPVWLAPVQAIALPIADRHNDAAGSVVARLREAGLRAELDDRTESVGPQDPRGRAAQDPVHARRRRPRGRGGHGRGAPPRRGRRGQRADRRLHRAPAGAERGAAVRLRAGRRDRPGAAGAGSGASSGCRPSGSAAGCASMTRAGYVRVDAASAGSTPSRRTARCACAAGRSTRSRCASPST